MAPEKAPAFQFYPKDWDTDVNVIPMTYEEEGVYWALCRMVWLHGTVTANLDELRLLLKGRPSLKQVEKWWVRIGPCFEVHGNRLIHKRLDRERKAQAESRERRAEAAKKRWDKEHSNADAMQMQSITNDTAKQCSPSASPSASPTAVNREFDRARHQGNGAFGVGTLPRDHMRHALCGPSMRICLLTWQFDTLARAYNAPENPHGTRAVIAQFIEQLESNLKPDSSIGAFSWIEKEFQTYLKAIGRVPPKIASGPKPIDPAHIERMLAIERGERRR